MTPPLKSELTISRSVKRPNYAYILFPGAMLEDVERASIAADSAKITIQFVDDGKYRVRRVSRVWHLSLPSSVTSRVPFGRHALPWERYGAYGLKMDLSRLAPVFRAAHKTG